MKIFEEGRDRCILEATERSGEGRVVCILEATKERRGSRCLHPRSDEGAERVGFEPTVTTRATTVFETAPIGHSGTSPIKRVHYTTKPFPLPVWLHPL